MDQGGRVSFKIMRWIAKTADSKWNERNEMMNEGAYGVLGGHRPLVLLRPQHGQSLFPDPFTELSFHIGFLHIVGHHL